MSKEPPPEGWLACSINAFAALVGLGRTSLYAEIKAGRLPVRHIGHRTVILRADAEAWLAGSRRGPEAGPVWAHAKRRRKRNVRAITG